MNSRIRSVSLALVASFAVSSALAQVEEADRKNVFTTIVEASETPVGAAVLPVSETSTLVITPCAGCPLKTYRPTAATQYFINRDIVTLQELKDAVAGKPKLMLTVSYTVKTNELVSITADIAGPARPAQRNRAK